jgi:hypothetical protein
MLEEGPCLCQAGRAMAERAEPSQGGGAHLQRGEVRQLRDDELQRAENHDPGLQATATMGSAADTLWQPKVQLCTLWRACSVRSQGPGAGPQAGWYRRYSAWPRGAACQF